MSLDPVANAAYSLVATAPSPAGSGTSLLVTAGEGARFPDPAAAGAYNCVVWAAGAQPNWAAGGASGGNFEIVRVTAKSTDTLTIARAQEGTTARSIVVGDQIALVPTAKTITDLAQSGAHVAYDFTVTGADKASIDTAVDGTAPDLSNAVVIEILLYVRTDDAVTFSDIGFTFNNDAGSNYNRIRLRANNAAVAAAAQGSATNLAASVAGANASASTFSEVRVIVHSAGIITQGNKSLQLTATVPSTTTTDSLIDFIGGEWRSTAAITRVAVSSNVAGKKLKVGSRLVIVKYT